MGDFKDVWAYEMPSGITYIGVKKGTPPATFENVVTVRTVLTPDDGTVALLYRNAYAVALKSERQLPRFTIAQGSKVLPFIDLEKAIAAYVLE